VFSVSGHVAKPGNYEVELGMSFRDLIEGLAGGVPGGKKMKFFIPGGASSPWLLPDVLDEPLDMDRATSSGRCSVRGDHGVSTRPSTRCSSPWRIAKFFAHESCGKCTPCVRARGGSRRCLPDGERSRLPDDLTSC